LADPDLETEGERGEGGRGGGDLSCLRCRLFFTTCIGNSLNIATEKECNLKEFSISSVDP